MSYVEHGAVVGAGCRIGHGSWIDREAKVGPRTVIGDGVRVGRGTVIGNRANIGSHSRIGSGVLIGHGVHLHSDTTIPDGGERVQGTRPAVTPAKSRQHRRPTRGMAA
jgi:UDP-3-O-[3-hydroxymyristoyl] glucosamine N-acyltransferase